MRTSSRSRKPDPVRERSGARHCADGSGDGTPLEGHRLLLLKAFSSPQQCVDFSEDEWDILIRTARQARLLGRLCGCLKSIEILDSLPQSVAAHLKGAYGFSLQRKHAALGVLWGLERVFGQCHYPVVLLKGASYIAQGLSASNGRLFDDIDIMVPRESLADAEGRLTSEGWKTEKPDAYDQHYYREWSHELPPMWHSNHAMELDVHHTILPVVARAKPVAERLLERSIPAKGSKFRVLSPVDQLIHASAHLFFDSDLQGRIRDLADLAALFDEHASGPAFWDELARESEIHGLSRSVWYAAHFCRSWLGVRVPEDFFRLLGRIAPGRLILSSMEYGVRTLAFPLHPNGREYHFPRPIASAFEARALWLRFPAKLLGYHMVMKAFRSSFGSKTGHS